eukprot:COSAG02_NODE_34459_length_484_cov_0.503896_1_plen_91_part_10
MGRKSKKSERQSGGPPDAPRDELKGDGWGFQQVGLESYCFLVVGVLSQAVTILISWPAWQVREVCFHRLRLGLLQCIQIKGFLIVVQFCSH